MLFLESRFRDLQTLVNQLRAFIQVHLHHSRWWQDQTQLQALQKTFRSVLPVDLSSLALKILNFAHLTTAIEHHPSLNYPQRLGDQCGYDACLNAGNSHRVHFFVPLGRVGLLPDLIAELGFITSRRRGRRQSPGKPARCRTLWTDLWPLPSYKFCLELPWQRHIWVPDCLQNVSHHDLTTLCFFTLKAGLYNIKGMGQSCTVGSKKWWC